MIEGLKVTVPGTELRQLCLVRALYHSQRAKVYGEQKANLESAKAEGMEYTGGDPIRAVSDKQTEHANSAREMDFIAAHLKLGEDYLLDTEALHRLGICTRRY